MIEKSDKGWFQIVSIDEGTEEFDRQYWASRTPEERLAAAWEMTVLAQKFRGGTEDELDRTQFRIHPIGEPDA